jgi:small nuclear ribonucleoprotein (snRNP)-like protein
MTQFYFVLPLAIAILSTSLFADQVVLKNGDRLTGTIVKSDGATLLIKTEFAGDVTIQWSAVQDISSSEELHLSLKNGKELVGRISTTDGNFVVVTKSAGKVETPKDAVSK